jgi:hypothetical protein
MVTLMEEHPSRLIWWLVGHQDENFVIVNLYEFTDYFNTVVYVAEIKGV